MFSPHISLDSSQVPTSHDIPRHPTTSHVSHLPGSTRTRFWASLPGLTPLGVAATAGDEALVNLGGNTESAKKKWKVQKRKDTNQNQIILFCAFCAVFCDTGSQKVRFLEEVSQEIACLRRSRGTKCCVFPRQSDKSPVFKF